MNCKPGDLAIRVRAPADAQIPVGAIVEVVRFFPDQSLIFESGRIVDGLDLWSVVYRGQKIGAMGLAFGIPDNELRPIRPNDGEDETLQWAGKPQKETA